MRVYQLCHNKQKQQSISVQSSPPIILYSTFVQGGVWRVEVHQAADVSLVAEVSGLRLLPRVGRWIWEKNGNASWYMCEGNRCKTMAPSLLVHT